MDSSNDGMSSLAVEEHEPDAVVNMRPLGGSVSDYALGVPDFEVGSKCVAFVRSMRH